MRRSPGQLTFLVVSILFAAIPFAFAIVRALQTRADLRYVWVALASFVGAAAVMTIGRARQRTPAHVLALSVVALLAATLLAGTVAFVVGARSALAMGLVAVGFGGCHATSLALHTLSRPRVP
jgi:O-antigen/teichoic acid export membrane protein